MNCSPKRSSRLALGIAMILVIAGAAQGTIQSLPITQVWQHKDTTMSCTAPGGNNLVHAHDHAVNPPPGDPHCGYYCAPASIAMYALYRGKAGSQTQMDDIYDNGKFTQGEVQSDGTIQTHGFGMFSAFTGSVGGPEVQTAFAWAVAAPLEWGSTYGPPMTGGEIISQINGNTPILWIDHGGYPNEVNPPLPEEWENYNGHAKLIAGYDDKNTAVFNDDEYLIFDPWPTSGSPYWAPHSTVVNGTDLYITDGGPLPTERRSMAEIKSEFAPN